MKKLRYILSIIYLLLIKRLDEMTSYDASHIFYFFKSIKIHPKCKINSAFNRKQIAKSYYWLDLTTGGITI